MQAQRGQNIAFTYNLDSTPTTWSCKKPTDAHLEKTQSYGVSNLKMVCSRDSYFWFTALFCTMCWKLFKTLSQVQLSELVEVPQSSLLPQYMLCLQVPKTPLKDRLSTTLTSHKQTLSLQAEGTMGLFGPGRREQLVSGGKKPAEFSQKAWAHQRQVNGISYIA